MFAGLQFIADCAIIHCASFRNPLGYMCVIHHPCCCQHAMPTIISICICAPHSCILSLKTMCQAYRCASQFMLLCGGGDAAV